MSAPEEPPVGDAAPQGMQDVVAAAIRASSQGPRISVGEAIRHPGAALRRLTGGAAVYPLLILFGFAMVDEFDRAAFSVLLPNIRDAFDLTNRSALSIVAVAALAGLVLQVPIALWADRGNRVRIMLIGAAVFALFSAGTGLAVFWWGLLIMRAGSGVGLATVGPTHNSLLSDYYGLDVRPRVFSFHRTTNALGALIGPITAGALAQAFSWRVPFLVFLIPSLVLLVVGLRMKEPVRGLHERLAMGASEEVANLEEPPPSYEEATRMVWKIESLRRIFYALPFLSAALIGFGSLASLLYEQKFGLTELQRGTIATITEPAQLVGLAAGAVIGTRLMRRRAGLILNYVAVVAVIASVLAAVFALAPTVWLGVLANMGIAASLAAVVPGVYAALSLAIPARARSIGFSLGALWVIPGLAVLPVVGWIADTWGIQQGMLLMTPVFLVGGLVIASGGNVIEQDMRNVWQGTTARAELMNERRAGRSKLLLVRKLDVDYGDVRVLFGVDFEVDEGEIVALLGTNGAGKSTLLRAITGVVQATNGAVVFDGRDITHAPPHEVAALGIAQVPGGQGVFPGLTVAENLRLAGWLERKEPELLAERTEQVLDTFPVLRDRLQDPAANLSGGQQQMLALGMAFLSRPRLLVIDELSLGLAPVIVEQLLVIVRAMRDQGTTIILVEQSVNVALTVAETAYFMEKGEIRFHGPTAELLERPDVLRSVFLEGAAAGMAVAQGGRAAEADRSGAPSPVGPDADRAPDATTPAEGSPGETPGGPVLEVAGLSVRFGGIRAVDDVSFELGAGEILGILGPNGAGKTTLFDLISGYTRGEGVVRLGGHDVSSRGPDARARLGLGRSFQDARLFPALTVEETIAVSLERWVAVKDPMNAALGLPAYQETEWYVHRRVDELIELLGIESFRTKFVRELSTGSRRVVDLACVLAHRPTVVLLDEPSSGIAQRETEALGPLVQRIRDELGASVIIIEHDMPLLTAVADRLLALESGHVVTMGPPAEVLRHPAVVESYLGGGGIASQRSGAAAGATVRAAEAGE